MASDISPKVLGGSFGAAVATIFWTIAAATFWETTFTDTELAALTGASAVVLAALVGYFVPDPRRNNPPVQPLDPTTAPPTRSL